MTSGWYPYANALPSPNHQPGRAAALAAVVLHVCDGAYWPSVNWLRDPAAGSSAHFVIAKDGSVAQLVSITDTAWGNGLSYVNGAWVSPEGHIVHPAWPGLIAGVNPNAQTISIEHEGTPADVWTPEMDAANTRLLRWIADQTGLVYTSGTTLIGHNDISPIDRPNCPGPTVPFGRVAAAGNLPSGEGTYTVNVPVANVRSGPARTFPVINTRRQGSPILGDTWVLGESVAGDARWLHRPGGMGFMHASVLTRA